MSTIFNDYINEIITEAKLTASDFQGYKQEYDKSKAPVVFSLMRDVIEPMKKHLVQWSAQNPGYKAVEFKEEGKTNDELKISINLNPELLKKSGFLKKVFIGEKKPIYIGYALENKKENSIVIQDNVTKKLAGHYQPFDSAKVSSFTREQAVEIQKIENGEKIVELRNKLQDARKPKIPTNKRIDDIELKLANERSQKTPNELTIKKLEIALRKAKTPIPPNKTVIDKLKFMVKTEEAKVRAKVNLLKKKFLKQNAENFKAQARKNTIETYKIIHGLIDTYLAKFKNELGLK